MAKNLGGFAFGGIVGELINPNTTTETIQNCKNYGTIKGYGYAGGIAGYLGREDKVSNCANYGLIQGSSVIRRNCWKK